MTVSDLTKGAQYFFTVAGQGRTQKYERGISKRESKINLINIHDIHTSLLITSQTCGVLVWRDIGAESPMLRPKVLLLHTEHE